MSQVRKTSPPPYFWKVPAPEKEKDFGSENYRRMKSIAAEGQRKRQGPLKAQFVPGVTRNSRYAHIQSKVGASLRKQHQQGPFPQKSFSDELANRRLQQSQKFAVNPQIRSTPVSQQFHNGDGQTRLSRSSVDLRSQTSQSGYRQEVPLRRHGSISASGGGVGEPARQSMSHPSIQIFQPNPPDESIYKWKFNDDPPCVFNNGDNTTNNPQSSQSVAPSPQCHRVEYLPCDGICKEETLVNNTNLDSARSNSSRTSRGCNTEETRIFPETMVHHQPQAPQPPFQSRSLIFPHNNGVSSEDLQNRALNSHADYGLRQQKRHFPMMNGSNSNESLFRYNSTSNNIQNKQQKGLEEERNFYPLNGRAAGGGDIEVKMKNMGIGNDEGVKSRQKLLQKDVGEGGDFPHALGKVPKYLKQRQETWRMEEAAKKEAESTAHIPPGYILMSEEERLDNLRQFRRSYEMLIAELNRVPITIDTIRVRNHKVDLERQLTRLEDAMKTFSRPKVWVKVDD